MPLKKWKVDGMDRLIKDMNKLEKMPQVAVNRAARMGGKVVLKSARSYAPVDTGYLKKGLVMKAEKRTKKVKKVYFVSLDKRMNDIFVKSYAGGSKRAYYPASQEWGFTVMGKYTPGYRYLRKSIDNNVKTIRKEVLKSLRKDIDKILGKRG